MSSREDKSSKKTTKNMSLPEDLLVSCLARVSKLYYPILSLVSKRFRSLLASKYVIETRSSIGRSESCLYVSLVNCSVSHVPNPRWFTLCRKPLTSDMNKKKSSGYVLAAIPSLDYPQTNRKSMVAVGSDIYYIGDIENACSSATVSILDCRTNTWQKAPDMPEKRDSPAVNVLDGKIYVTGGGCNGSDPFAFDVFDPKTQTWELKSSPKVTIGVRFCIQEIDGAMSFFRCGIGNGNHNGFIYGPKKGLRKAIMRLDTDVGAAYCVIRNVLYCYDFGFKWFDTKVKRWVPLEGVKGLPKLPRDCVRLADYGGKMVVLWEKIVGVTEYKKKIFCSVITLERLNGEGVRGMVEWCDTVLTVPESQDVEHVLAVTV